jgi:hypothetical protein
MMNVNAMVSGGDAVDEKDEDSGEEVQVLMVVDGNRQVRYPQEEKRIELLGAKQQQQLVLVPRLGTRATERVLVCGRVVEGELLVRVAAGSERCVGDVLATSSVADHWCAAMRGGGQKSGGELVALVRARKLFYAVAFRVPGVARQFVVAAHPALWPRPATAALSCESDVAASAALVEHFGSKIVLGHVFATVAKWEQRESPTAPLQIGYI